MKTALPPPNGFKSWLDYAIATMDVRSVLLESLFNDSNDLSPSGDQIRATAQAELDALVALAKQGPDRGEQSEEPAP